jgi:hypothetical protein
MANTFVALATVTVGSGGAANIEFTSIPATYTDLLVKFSLRTPGTGNYANNRFSFNSSTTSYSSKLLYGVGSAAGSISNSVTNAIDFSAYSVENGATSNTFSNGELYLPNYAGSNNKSVSIDTVGENNSTETITALTAGLWTNTSAITSIKITAGQSTFNQYSTATLYGIKNS